VLRAARALRRAPASGVISCVHGSTTITTGAGVKSMQPGLSLSASGPS
jgi:hypothetical protein